MIENNMEPVILVDKSNKQETHIVSSVYNSFEDLIASARRIDSKNFKGDWDLVYIDETSKEPVIVKQEEEIGKYLSQNIDTFYWKYRKKEFPIHGRSTSRSRKYQHNDPKRFQKKSYRSKSKATPVDRTYNIIRYADMGKRILAFFIDLMILGAIGSIVKFHWSSFILFWLYFAITESSPSQASLGKRIMGIRVGQTTGVPLDFTTASIRAIIKFVSYGIPILLFIAFFMPKNQALHDIFTGTLVLEKK